MLVLRAGVTCSCEPPGLSAGNLVDLLEEQPVLVTVSLSPAFVAHLEINKCSLVCVFASQDGQPEILYMFWSAVTQALTSHFHAATNCKFTIILDSFQMFSCLKI